MNDISLSFSEASYNPCDGLTLSTPSCGCCAEHYNTAYGSYQDWKVSYESLEKYIKSERERLDALEKFVNEYKASGDTHFLVYAD